MLSSKRILIVEDEILVALDLERQLEQLGCSYVRRASDAKGALQIVADESFDLALLDIRMGGPIDGIELGAYLRVQHRIPIIYISAFSDEATINRAKHTEPLGYLVKPISEEILKSTLEIALHRDAADAKRREEDYRQLMIEKTKSQMEKLEAIGRLTGGIAHALNNALTVVMGSIGQATWSENDATHYQSRLETALQSCTRCKVLIQELLEFAGQGPCDLERFVLDELIESYLKDLAELFRPNVSVSFLKPEVPREVSVDRERLMVSLWSILDNAQRAMPEGGTITIACGETYIDLPEAHNLSASNGIFATLKIRDNGPGMTEDMLKRVFEPFFSSKDRATTAGMGLSQVYGLMQRQGGWATVESQLGKGTEVTLYFPIEEQVSSLQEGNLADGSEARDSRGASAMTAHE